MLNNPVITILHNIPGRVRLKFSHIPSNGEALALTLKEDDRIVKAIFNPTSSTLLIQFRHMDVELLHILKKIVLNMSEEYGMMPVYIHVQGNNRLSALTKLSAIAILAAGTVYLMDPGNLLLTRLSGSIAATVTAAAVVGHALDEIRNKGTFDPEALSIVFLINSIASGEFIRGAFFTWLAAFSRHLLSLPQHEGLKIRVVEGRDKVTGCTYKDLISKGSIPLNPSLVAP